MAPSAALHSNFNVDYVVTYEFGNAKQPDAQAGYRRLVQALESVGLQLEVRNGDKTSLLVFVRATQDKGLSNAVHRARVKDWLYGVRSAQPDRDAKTALTKEPLTEAERYRVVHHLITGAPEEGGANITPQSGDWENVKGIFPLHDTAENREWIKTWSRETFLQPEDLDKIRDRLGEKVAYYFAFTQSYFQFLTAPALFGFACHFLLPHFSPIYAIFNGLWCVTFIEYWKKQEVDLSIRWGVNGVSAIQHTRKDFKYEKQITDPVTGETIGIFPSQKRLFRQLLQIPFAILASIALGMVITVCFGIEIFLSEVYSGPFKDVLVYLPTVLLTIFVPTITSVLTGIATRLNDFENWETEDGYHSAMTQKIFILNFITDYLGIMLTAFIYVPFGSLIVPYLDIFHLTAKPFAENAAQLTAPKVGFAIDPSRLRKQVIYFTVNAQIVNFAMENIVPYLKRQVQQRWRKMGQAKTQNDIDASDNPEEAEFLSRVRSQAQLDIYDVTEDLREMVVQFGYLSLFAVVWPLTGLSFLINNWIELRSDAVKICIDKQRPIPDRADTIGPWLDSLSFLVWLGSVTSAALVYLFSNDGLGPTGVPYDIKGWALLLSILFSEHLYLVVRLAVRFAISKLDSPGMRREQAERYAHRKKYLLAEFGQDALALPPIGGEHNAGGEKKEITRASLEEDARKASLHASTPESRFWSRQIDWRETATVGERLMARAKEGKTDVKKEGKKEL